MILVIGASGNLGGHVTRQLLAQGHTVRAMTRDPARAAVLKEAGAEIVQGDLRDIASVRSAMRGVREVVSASHSILGSGKTSSANVDDIGQRSLIDSAKEAGVVHFVFTSIIGASPTHSVDFWRTKARIEKYLRASGMGYTIIRPTAFMEIHAYELIGKDVVNGKTVKLFGTGTNPRNFVAAADVATLVVLALRDASLRDQIIEIGGPQNLTGHQVVETFERVANTKAKIKHLPLPALRILSRVVGPFHSGVSRIMRVAISGETTDQRFDTTPLLDRFPLKLTTLEEWARLRNVVD